MVWAPGLHVSPPGFVYGIIMAALRYSGFWSESS